MSGEINELESTIPALLDRIQRDIKNVDMIIIHGSALDQSKFRPGKSDLDILVISNKYSYMDDPPDLSDIKGPWNGIDLTISGRGVLRHRNYELSFIARVLRGRVIFDSGFAQGLVTPERDLAKSEMVFELLQFSFRRMGFARTGKYLDKDARWHIARAACSAMQSFLVEHDFDVAEKDLRWNLPRLIEFAAGYEPALAKLTQFVEFIPYELASANPDCKGSIEGTPELLRQVRREKAATLLILRAVKRMKKKGAR